MKTCTQQLESFSHIPVLKDCKSVFVAEVILILLYWTLVVCLFHKGPWRQQYYSRVVVTTLCGTFLASTYTSDPTVISTLILPAVIDLCIIACVISDVYHSIRSVGTELFELLDGSSVGDELD